MGGDRRLCYLRERLVGTAGPQGTFGYPRHAPSLTASERSQALSRGADFRSRSIDGTVEMFFRNPGNRQPQGGPPHLFACFKTPERTPSVRDVLNGTFRTCRDGCLSPVMRSLASTTYAG